MHRALKYSMSVCENLQQAPDLWSRILMCWVSRSSRVFVVSVWSEMSSIISARTSMLLTRIRQCQTDRQQSVYVNLHFLMNWTHQTCTAHCFLLNQQRCTIFTTIPIKPLLHCICRYTVNRKNTPKCFCHIFQKTQSILIKVGTRCPE